MTTWIVTLTDADSGETRKIEYTAGWAPEKVNGPFVADSAAAEERVFTRKPWVGVLAEVKA